MNLIGYESLSFKRWVFPSKLMTQFVALLIGEGPKCHLDPFLAQPLQRRLLCPHGSLNAFEHKDKPHIAQKSLVSSGITEIFSLAVDLIMLLLHHFPLFLGQHRGVLSSLLKCC